MRNRKKEEEQFQTQRDVVSDDFAKWNTPRKEELHALPTGHFPRELRIYNLARYSCEIKKRKRKTEEKRKKKRA